MASTANIAQSSAPPAGVWLAESVRLSLFFLSEPSDHLALWREITGNDPDTITQKPSQGFRQANGSFGHGQLVMRHLPLRIDFIYAPNQPDPNTTTDTPIVHIGPAREALQLFDTIIAKIDCIDGACFRLAYAPVMLVANNSVAACNRVFKKYNQDVNVREDVDSDVFFQINRPEISRHLESLTLNKIYKWQVAEFSLLTINPDVKSITTDNSTSICRLELDFSTPSVRTVELDKELQKNVIAEMRSSALEFL